MCIEMKYKKNFKKKKSQNERNKTTITENKLWNWLTDLESKTCLKGLKYFMCICGGIAFLILVGNENKKLNCLLDFFSTSFIQYTLH